jgi:hypothetical protein
MSQGPIFGSNSGFVASIYGVGRAQPETVIFNFRDVAVMGKSIEQWCGHFGIAKHARPFPQA